MGNNDEQESWRVESLVTAAAAPFPDGRSARESREALQECRPEPVAEVLERRLLQMVDLAWGLGWLPGELLRQVERARSNDAERLAAAAVAADHRRRDHSTLHPRWAAHVEGLDFPPFRGIGGMSWIEEYCEVEAYRWRDVVDAAVDVLSVCLYLKQLAIIVPPPGRDNLRCSAAGTDTGASASSGDAPDHAPVGPMLAKVRALLTKAEWTGFDAEADAFTAKAQELMARHSIDAAMLWGRSSRSEEPITIRIPLDEPYVRPKNLLLHYVATHSGCRTVHDGTYSFTSIVGFESDVLAAETLFTSLLVQAQAALGRAGAGAGAGSHLRSRSFRSSFLISYATRINTRLQEINEHIMAEAEAEAEAAARTAGGAEAVDAEGESGKGESNDGFGYALVPVLADRKSAVDDSVEQQFGKLVSRPISGGHDLSGWAAGSRAADLAKLSLGDLTP